MDAEQKFVQNFAAARRALNLTQAQVGARMSSAGIAGWTKRTVQNLEAGERSPRVREAEHLARIVCVPLDRMITETSARVVQIAKDNMRGVA